jgi:hypothetical protein
MSFKQASSVNACLPDRGVRPDGMRTFHGRLFLLFGFFLLSLSFLTSLLPAKLFGLSRDLQGIIIMIAVTATPRQPGATTPLHTDHNPTHMYTQMFATCVSLPRKIGQSTGACVRVSSASVRLSKPSEGTNATQVSSSEGVFCKRSFRCTGIF